MKCRPRQAALAMLAALSASIALADDFKTIDGKEYKNVSVSRSDEPDGITITNKKSGLIAKLYFTELPKEVQERFHYDPVKADEYSRKQNEEQEQRGKQQEETMRRKNEQTHKNNEQFDKEQRGLQWTEKQQEKIQQLQTQYNELQHEEDDFIRRIQEAERLPRYLTGQSGRKHYSYLNPAWQYVPDWEKGLRDVRDEKGKVREQLEEAKRSTGK